MRKKGENSVKCAGKSAIPPDKRMISLLISKVNPSNFADFAALRAAVLWWKVLNPLYNPARLPPTWPAPASASDAVGVGPRGLQLLTARGAYWGLGSGCERNRWLHQLNNSPPLRIHFNSSPCARSV